MSIVELDVIKTKKSLDNLIYHIYKASGFNNIIFNKYIETNFEKPIINDDLIKKLQEQLKKNVFLHKLIDENYDLNFEQKFDGLNGCIGNLNASMLVSIFIKRADNLTILLYNKCNINYTTPTNISNLLITFLYSNTECIDFMLTNMDINTYEQSDHPVIIPRFIMHKEHALPLFQLLEKYSIKYKFPTKDAFALNKKEIYKELYYSWFDNCKEYINNLFW